MAKKISIETKAALLKYYFEEKCSLQGLANYALVKYEVEVTRQSIAKWIKNKLGFSFIFCEL